MAAGFADDYVLARPANACEAAREAAEQRGLGACVLSTVLEGESREAGTFLASIAKEVRLNCRPVAPPCLLIAGGETTTRVEGACGQGGPSQELALGFALEIADHRGICLCVLDTDWTDGPTSLAGGLVDGTTVARINKRGWMVINLCAPNDSCGSAGSGHAVSTGNTGTNVCDLNIVYVEEPH